MAVPVFARQVSASPLAASLAVALRTPLTPSRPVQSTFLSPSKTAIPTVSSQLVSYTPPDMSTTTPPIPSQTSPKSSTVGIFAQLARFSQPAPPAALRLQLATTPAPPSNFYASPVGTSPGNFLAQQLAAGSPIASYNPSPPDLGVATVGATPFVGYPPAPGPAAPMGASATLPAPGGGGYGPGGDYPGSGDGAYLTAGDLTPMADLTKPDYQKLALYGAAGLGGLYLLSRIFKA